MSEAKGAGAGAAELRIEEVEELFRLAWRSGDHARAIHWVGRGADAKRLLAEEDAWRGPSDPLCQAIESEEWDLARLISFRVKERSGFDGKTPLMLCAQARWRPQAQELAREMLALGAPLWRSDDSGMDALTLAARCGNEPLVQAMLRAARERGELEAHQAQVSLALRHGSALKGHFTPAIVWELLAAGANPDEPGLPREKSAREMMSAHEEPRRSELLGVLSAFEEKRELREQGEAPAAARSGPRL